jgi:two-component system, OmpR family, alkaline phosphatase synthesis response regulator PhoP
MQPRPIQNILLVEDDPEIRRLITLHFDMPQYKLTCCSTGNEALESLANNQFNLIILDISLPDSDGLELCKKIRSTDSSTSLMMLTCHSDESDKVLALELGADDYVTKPFGILELKARVKAIIRRSNASSETVVEDDIVLSDISISQSKRKACLKGVRLDLTVKEFDLLCLLATNPGKTFSRKELLQQIWGFTFAGYEHTVTSHINRLRLKLEADLNHPKYILTAWGSGYRFAE